MCNIGDIESARNADIDLLYGLHWPGPGTEMSVALLRGDTVQHTIRAKLHNWPRAVRSTNIRCKVPDG